MPEETTFKLVIVSPDKVIFENDAIKVTVPGFVQELAILPNHTPLYSELVKGVIRFETPSHQVKEIEIDGGILRVRRNRVSIILGLEAAIEQKQPTTN